MTIPEQSVQVSRELISGQSREPDPGGISVELAELERDGLRRRLMGVSGPCGPEIVLDGRSIANFGSNNYLDLAGHKDVMRAACEATAAYGTGAGASRLITGNHDLYGRLESALAEFKQAESALVFSTGYMANLGTVCALVGKGDVVVADRLSHASLVDACRLSGARLLVFPHNDTDRLNDVLARHRPKHRRSLIVTEGLFSMDGDTSPISALTETARRHDSWLMVDDAHATGILGSEGRGSFERAGVVPGPKVVQMGTLSKAMGSVGGFIAGTRELVDLLVNRSRTLIYSTGLPAGCVAASIAALEVSRREPWRRRRLAEMSIRIRTSLMETGLDVMAGEGPVIPVVLGGNERAMNWMEQLAARGLFVPGIRPPTVPPGSARLRISLMATHSDEQISRLVSVCAGLAKGKPS
jgi:8-amino-7-oxononanoate synthase